MAERELAKSGLLPIQFTTPGYRSLIYSPEEKLLVVQSPYGDKTNLKRLGGSWHPGEPKGWAWFFSIKNLSSLLDTIPFDFIDPLIEAEATKEENRAKLLNSIKRAALKDQTISLRIPGIKPKKEGVYLRNYQKLGVQFATIVENGLLIGDEMGLGKALVHDVSVITPEGKKKINELIVGDLVIGKNGKPTKVIGVYPQGLKDAYKVTFSDESTIECCDEHLWEVNTPTRNNRKSPYLVKTLREIIDEGVTRKNGKNGDRLNWYIPMVDAIEFEEKPLKLHPYILGFLIGDGSLSSGRKILFTTGDDEIVERIELLLSSSSLKVSKQSTKYQYAIIRKEEVGENWLVNYIKDLDLTKTSNIKHIPKSYLYSSIENRIELLRGLMDAAGTVLKGKRGNLPQFCTTSKELCEDFVFLIQSLGGIANVTFKDPYYYNKEKEKVHCKKAYIVSINIPQGLCPFYLTRKADLYRNDGVRKYNPSRAIQSIEYVGKKEMTCISVEAEDKLFVIDNCIVTHNSVQGLSIAIWRRQFNKAKRCLVVAPASLKYNWKEELEFWTDEDFIIIDGTPNKREKLWAEECYFTVVNPELLVRDFDEVPSLQKPYDIVIVDEIHMLKNYKSQRSKFMKKLKINPGGIKIGLSGTPIDGKLEDLHSIFEFLVPGLFPNRGTFLDKFAIRDQWNSVTGYINVDEVKKTIEPHFLRRLKKDVAKELPEKIFKNVYVDLSSEERIIYNAIKKQAHKITEEAQAITTILRARQFCNAPGLVDEYPEFGAKYETCMHLLEEIISNGHKVLIFSMFEQMVDKLYVAFEKNGWKSLKITGKTKKQDRPLIARQLNEDPTIDICVMDEAGSTGLNFQGASYVIHYDDNWSPAIMKQRTDRAHRITTTHVVTVVNFVCRDTIEDNVRGVLQNKDLLSASAIGDNIEDVFSIKGFSAKKALSYL